MTRVTIATIAAEAGVSVPTVSRVLNGRVDVAAETRTRIITALRSLENKRDTNPRKKHGNIPL